MAIRESRERHAAHTGPGSGWDLEVWDVSGVDWRPHHGQANPDGVPADAQYHCGSLTSAGGQHWYFVRKAPLSDGTCERCAPAVFL